MRNASMIFMAICLLFATTTSMAIIRRRAASVSHIFLEEAPSKNTTMHSTPKEVTKKTSDFLPIYNNQTLTNIK